MHVLEQILGEGSLALCTNGAAADVDPTLEMPYWGPRNDQMASHLGRLFAAQMLEALERTEVQDVGELAIAREEIELAVREDWFRLMESEQARMRQEFASGWKFSSVVEEILDRGAIFTEVQALRLNRFIILVGFPGEIFSRILDCG